MVQKHSEMKAGIFIMLCFILFWVMLFSISDMGTLFVPKRTYVFAFNQVGGLTKNSPVDFAGYEAGRVVKITFAEPPDVKTGKEVVRKRVPETSAAEPAPNENVFLTINMRNDIQLTNLDRAHINSSLTGTVVLDILPGKPQPGEKAFPIDDSYVLDGEPYVTMGELVDRASAVVEEARQTMPQVQVAVNTLTDTVKAAGTTVQKVNAAIDDNRPRLDQTMKNAAEAGQNLNAMMTDIKPKLTEMVDQIHAAAKTASETLTELKPKAVATFDNAQEATDNFKKTSNEVLDTVARNRQKLDQIVENFRDASARLSLGIEDIRRNPWKLLDRNINADPRTQNVYDSALAFSEAARSLSQATADLKAMQQSGAATPETVDKASKELDKLMDNLDLIEKDLFKMYKSPPGP